MLSRPSRSPRQYIIAGLLLGIFLIFITLSLPTLESVTPEPGSQSVPSTTKILLSFSRPMDRVSVESRLTIKPEIPGQFEWQGDSLHFQPSRSWPRGEVVTVRLAPGARSRAFLPIFRSHHWSFTIGVPRIIYLWPAEGKGDLYSRTVDGEETLQLTETAHGVLDFSVNLKEAAVVYTEIRQDGGTDLRWIDLVSGEDQLLLSCRANWRCQAPTISPGFEAVAFERSPLEAGPEAQWVFGDPSVWMLEMKVDSDPARISPSGHITSQPRWSPKGQLAYYDATLKAIQIVDPFAEPTPSKIRSIPSDLGLIGEWSPNGSSLLYPGVVILDPSPGESDLLQGSASAFYSHLFRVNLDTGIRMDLSGSQFGLVEDAGPVYSPDGLFIAFTRKFLDEDRWTPGRQLWIMRTDGTEPRQITRDPTYHHSALDWNPESNGLVFLRTNQNDFAQTPEVWLYDVKRDQIRPFVVGGYFPQWTP